MNRHLLIRIVRLLPLVVCSLGVCSADEVASKGQEIFDKYQGAVVTVQVVSKTSYSKDGKTFPQAESKYELTGSFVDPSGLVALAHSGCDPAEFYKQATTQYEGYKVDSEVVDLKLLLEDGTEVPGRIVLRDKDLDLAFVRPKTPLPHPVKALDLSAQGSARILDQVIVLNRLNQGSGRAYSATVARIIAKVSRPRPFYLYDSTGSGAALGSPVFSLDGKLLGLMLMRIGGPRGADEESTVSIILPAEQILKAARQAPPSANAAPEPSPSATKSTTPDKGPSGR